ncbi:MAG: zf-HC2 domain-containing protein [Gemmataceae bacterium]|nr:zf-HC2 domain-containing protein [Gemmataceae bacterium]
MNPHPCQHALDLLLDYLSGDLPSETRSEFEIHLRDCPPCTTYVQTYRLTISMTRQLPLDAPLPPEFEARLLEMARKLQDSWGH